MHILDRDEATIQHFLRMTGTTREELEASRKADQERVDDESPKDLPPESIEKMSAPFDFEVLDRTEASPKTGDTSVAASGEPREDTEAAERRHTLRKANSSHRIR